MKEKYEAIKKAVSDAPDINNVDEDQPYELRFKEFWPVIDKALDFAIESRLTKERADEALVKVRAIGERMASGEISDTDSQEFLDRLGSIWNYVRSALLAVTALASSKTGSVIDKVIDIGDWMLADAV